MTELKPCPFCGGKAKLYRDRLIGVHTSTKPWIGCTECTASMYASSAVRVIEAWNRRVTDKDYEVEVVTRGNCMVCGKELTEGLFFCKECEAKGK